MPLGQLKLLAEKATSVGQTAAALPMMLLPVEALVAASVAWKKGPRSGRIGNAREQEFNQVRRAGKIAMDAICFDTTDVWKQAWPRDERHIAQAVEELSRFERRCLVHALAEMRDRPGGLRFTFLRRDGIVPEGAVQLLEGVIARMPPYASPDIPESGTGWPSSTAVLPD